MRGALMLVVAMVMGSGSLVAQTAEDPGAQNAKQARAALDAMVQALGDQA